MPLPIPLRGDRSAWDDIGYPGLHSRDLDEGTPRHHLPAASSAGQRAVWDGSKWVADSGRSAVLFYAYGSVSTGSDPMRIANHLGRNLTIVGVYLDIEVAPTGADLIVDIHNSGTTIFTTQSNRPRIFAASKSGYSTTVEVSDWGDEEYLQMSIDQVGSTIPGSDLTVTVVYR